MYWPFCSNVFPYCQRAVILKGFNLNMCSRATTSLSWSFIVFANEAMNSQACSAAFRVKANKGLGGGWHSFCPIAAVSLGLFRAGTSSEVITIMGNIKDQVCEYGEINPMPGPDKFVGALCQA